MKVHPQALSSMQQGESVGCSQADLSKCAARAAEQDETGWHSPELNGYLFSGELQNTSVSFLSLVKWG